MALLAFPARHLAWTESALFGFDKFSPISKAYLLGISIYTAGWQSSVRLWETSFCAQRLLKLQLHSRQLLCTNLFIVGVGMSAFGQRRTDESMSQSSTATAVCMSSTESAPSALGKFSPISKAYLLEISICTASWWVVASRANSCGARDLCGQAFTQNIRPIWSEASACGKHPSSVHVGCLRYGCIVDSSVYQSFHARCCKFGLRIFGLNWVCTLWFWQVLANFKSLSSGNLDLYTWLTVKRPPVGNIFLCPKVAWAAAAQ